MCHFNYPTITGLQHFPSLTSLCIVAQDIRQITNLHHCPNLKKLWICETKITQIQSLDNCTELVELFLYSNKIKKISGLDKLLKLERLWLSDNEITKIPHLGTLVKLQDLQLGNNLIEAIGESLSSNSSLQSLNIAGNRLSSFRDVLFLASLPKLTSLCLSDPNYADNPLCSLCNYQTHVIYHLPNLKSLDTLDVTDESRRIISATVLKKRMYYNMRIRTIKRNTNFLLKMLHTRARDDERQIEADVFVLMEKCRKVQRRRDDLGLPPTAETAKAEVVSDKMEVARICLNQLIETKMRALHQLQLHKKEIGDQILQQSDMAVRKLLLELETGGNVRFEEDQKEDSWFETCEALVKSMILRAKSKHHHKRIQIHRISRVHNRFLKNKFDAKVRSSNDSMQSFEYLCFQGGQFSSDEIFSAVEHGFGDSSDRDPPSNQTPIRFSNFLEFGEHGERKQLHQAIIVKAFANKTQRLENPETSLTPVTDERLMALAAEYPGTHCLYYDVADGAMTLDPCRHYVVLDRELALPEYFVEYSIKSDLEHLTTKVEKLMVDIAFSNKLSQADMPSIILQITRKIADVRSSTRLDRRQLMQNVPLSKLQEEHPDIMVADSFVVLTTELKDLLSKKSPDCVETLNMSMAGSKLQWSKFQRFTHLRNLTLSMNGLREFPDVRHCPLLEKLDVSMNVIASVVSKMTIMQNLKHLNLAKNNISHFENILHMRDHLSNLTALNLQFNPIAKRKGFRQIVAGTVGPKTLILLDGKALDASEKSIPFRLHAEFLRAHSSRQPHLFRPLSVRTQSGYGSSATQNEFWRMHEKELDRSAIVGADIAGWLDLESITTLELDDCNLFDLDMLPLRLVHLRWASFRNNNLRDVSRLALFPRLEELSLENNEIESIDGLAPLQALTKLDASNNRIATVDAAKNFKSLMLLSLENNRVKHLKPFAKMATLMEFYIGNNYISELYCIFPLKELPRLIILDLTGNAVSQISNYRLFSIFHLSRLKIIDGASITPKEQTQAKEAFLGKLTVELLGDKIGHFSFKNISELDLRGSKIREIDCFNAVDFRNLRKLNFDNNLLATVDAFVCLGGLKSLSVAGNRIEKLLVGDAPAVMGPYGWRIESQEPVRGKILFPALEELQLGGNCVVRIADLGLYRMPQLKVLNLSGNRISKLDGLEHLTNLVELVLDKNHIKMAEQSSFLPLINLKELHIRENRLRTLAHFDCLPNLQYLMLTGNRIAELTDIERMKLPSLIEINLAQNAVSRKQLYRLSVILRFPQIICIDDKEVSEEERQRAEMCYMEQCMMREDMAAPSATTSSSSALKMPMSIQAAPLVSAAAAASAAVQSNSLSKLPIKITSVVLDGWCSFRIVI
ncbi:hypothetical protein DFJ73DRAFT_623012 [Zopfochytrium polystomum]|nr:hypothetical protein DFJ73DRAFT_623012 [Zopfochytrium polystomum]